jgi:hypothetical protein
MKSEYIETFEIPGCGRYCISHNQYGYQVWSGGCAIGGPVWAINEARCYIHNHAKETLARSLTNTERLLTKLTISEVALGSDVFRLGQFLTKNT